MENKCKNCGILLDILCINPICIGHQNKNMGDICYYCVTNQREIFYTSSDFQSLLFSILRDFDIDIG
jgi:hypothetical protein